MANEQDEKDSVIEALFERTKDYFETRTDLIKLKAIGCEAAIVGKAIYENRITLKQLEKFILSINY